MKKLICLFLTAVLIGSCELINKEEPDTIICKDTALNLPAKGGEKTISFEASSNWSAEADGQAYWYSITPFRGQAGKNNVLVVFEPNDTYEERSSSVKLTCGTAEHTIVITQEANIDFIVSPTEFDVEAEGGFIKVEVMANMDFSCKIADNSQSWISTIESKGLESHQLLFEIQPNDEAKDREGLILIHGGEKAEIVTVRQKSRSEEPEVKFESKSYTVGPKSEKLEVKVTSNITLDIEIADKEWISEAGSSSTGYYFNIQENTGFDSRRGSIIFKNEEHGIRETVTVTQMQKDALVIGHDTYSIDAEGGEFNITVGHNVEFSTDINVDWIEEISTKALEEKKLTFRVEANSGESREGKTPMLIASATR